MAAGSEKFSWKLFPGIRRQCWQCKREPLKIADVGEYRRRYPGAKVEFLCKDCQRYNLEQAIIRRKETNAVQRS